MLPPYRLPEIGKEGTAETKAQANTRGKEKVNGI
jgi:hypothetical protein